MDGELLVLDCSEERYKSRTHKGPLNQRIKNIWTNFSWMLCNKGEFTLSKRRSRGICECTFLVLMSASRHKNRVSERREKCHIFGKNRWIVIDLQMIRLHIEHTTRRGEIKVQCGEHKSCNNLHHCTVSTSLSSQHLNFSLLKISIRFSRKI